eukprot:TRINITY_DN4512_c0_g1_i1.p1 TRINITY_DN4512_c0_g1~~TRINITY_DN4512_c0_g1_i1.p1  ORF type:complete len:815 (+),score=120.01 TRINITY_DN4512_c0_g1_i1:198-2642(+)
MAAAETSKDTSAAADAPAQAPAAATPAPAAGAGDGVGAAGGGGTSLSLFGPLPNSEILGAREGIEKMAGFRSDGLPLEHDAVTGYTRNRMNGSLPGGTLIPPNWDLESIELQKQEEATRHRFGGSLPGADPHVPAWETAQGLEGPTRHRLRGSLPGADNHLLPQLNEQDMTRHKMRGSLPGAGNHVLHRVDDYPVSHLGDAPTGPISRHRMNGSLPDAMDHVPQHICNHPQMEPIIEDEPDPTRRRVLGSLPDAMNHVPHHIETWPVPEPEMGYDGYEPDPTRQRVLGSLPDAINHIPQHTNVPHALDGVPEEDDIPDWTRHRVLGSLPDAANHVPHRVVSPYRQERSTSRPKTPSSSTLSATRDSLRERSSSRPRSAQQTPTSSPRMREVNVDPSRQRVLGSLPNARNPVEYPYVPHPDEIVPAPDDENQRPEEFDEESAADPTRHRVLGSLPNAKGGSVPPRQVIPPDQMSTPRSSSRKQRSEQGESEDLDPTRHRVLGSLPNAQNHVMQHATLPDYGGSPRQAAALSNYGGSPRQAPARSNYGGSPRQAATPSNYSGSPRPFAGYPSNARKDVDEVSDRDGYFYGRGKYAEPDAEVSPSRFGGFANIDRRVEAERQFQSRHRFMGALPTQACDEYRSRHRAFGSLPNAMIHVADWVDLGGDNPREGSSAADDDVESESRYAPSTTGSLLSEAVGPLSELWNVRRAIVAEQREPPPRSKGAPNGPHPHRFGGELPNAYSIGDCWEHGADTVKESMSGPLHRTHVDETGLVGLDRHEHMHLGFGHLFGDKHHNSSVDTLFIHHDTNKLFGPLL